MNCHDCKHELRCDGIPGDDCFERRVDTEPCPPPEHVSFDDDLFLVEAYASLKKHCPDVRISKRCKLSGRFLTLERARAMRQTP